MSDGILDHMHLDLTTTLTILSTAATIGFGIYSVTKARPSRRSTALFLVLLVLYLGQLLGPKLTGQTLMSQGTFSGIVIVFVALIFNVVSRE